MNETAMVMITSRYFRSIKPWAYLGTITMIFL
jgi:hypothetical protein